MPRTGRPPAPRIIVQCVGCGADIHKRQGDVDKAPQRRWRCGRNCPGMNGEVASFKPRRGTVNACPQCGRDFYLRPSSSTATAGGSAACCSVSCAAKQREARSPQATVGVPPVAVTCPQCGKGFRCYPSQLRANGTKLCSQACQVAARRVPIEERTCEQCDRQFTPARAVRLTARFCSNECYRQFSGSLALTCRGCGTEYMEAQSTVKHSPGHGEYCRDCHGGNKGNAAVARVELACTGCGVGVMRKPSEASGTGRVYCSIACQTSQTTVIQVECPVCAKSFPRKRNKATTPSGRPACCSPQCAGVLRSQGLSEAGAKPGREILSTCEVCEAKFIHHGSRPRRYCSPECHQTRSAVAQFQCKNCGGTFATRGTRKYCNRDCFYEHRALTATGSIKDGYRLVTVNGRQVPEHRHRMSQLLGRPLLPNETVHHLNTDRSDNSTDGPLRWVNGSLRSGNLELWVKSQPSGGRLGETGPFDAELYPATV